MAEKARIIGAAAGVIMAIIITLHMTTSAPPSTQLHTCDPGIAMSGIAGMSTAAMSDIAEAR